ncbi:permease, partial [Staphylococcus warneri]
GINAAKVFGATPGLGGVIGGTTLLTGISDKNPIVNIFTGEPLLPSQGGIIGVIIGVWLLSLIEKRLHKIVPNAIDIIITPTLTLLI